ncbi:toll/interleukin-1 receptor domain-containing protein, partial [bacterium]|nr:toll/interleukin-1 receptor domain-containing protein [bacterium]
MPVRTYPTALVLSHARADREFACRLTRDLENAGAKVSTFEAESLFGAFHMATIREGIAAAAFWAVILTPAIVASDMAKNELERAMASDVVDSEVEVLPLLRSPCKLPACLNRKRCTDFTEDQGYEAAFGRLLGCLRRAADAHAPGREGDPVGRYPTGITIDPIPGLSARLVSLFCQYYENFYRWDRISVGEACEMKLADAGLIVFHEYYEHGQWGYEFTLSGCRLVRKIYGRRVRPCPRGLICE